MFRHKYLIILYLAIIPSSIQLPLIEKAKDCYDLSSLEEIRVFLTISSLYVSTTEDGVVKRQLEVNWVGDGDSSHGDRIDVYNEDPNLHPSAQSIFSFEPENHPSGYLRTDIELPVTFFNVSSIEEERCLGYWAAYSKNHEGIVSTSCLQMQPKWMGTNSNHLSNLRLTDVMIPGSHDSGSFYFHRENAPLTKYKYAQEEPIFNQLIYGLRYFDLRVGYYEKTEEKYFINHNFLKTEHSIKSVLHQVMRFIKATKEIVILDFHNFPIGFRNKFIHFKLMNLILHTFGAHIIPHTSQFKEATFGDLWALDKRVLISYDSKVRDILYPKLLWPSIPRAWGNKQHPADLKEYFQQVFQNPTPKGLWASMAELTPNTRTIVMHPETGLRIFADKINRNVTHWFRDFYWKKANIVATDYFLGNDIIDVAIRANKIKGLCPEDAWPKVKL